MTLVGALYVVAGLALVYRAGCGLLREERPAFGWWKW